MGETYQEGYYKFISIHDWHTTPKNRPLEELAEGKDPLGVAVSFKLIEANPMREALKIFTQARIAYLKKNKALQNWETMSGFIDETPGYNCLFQLMGDFYNNRPTMRSDLEDAMFKTGRSADRHIARFLKQKSIIRQDSENDTRIKVYTPSILTILVFEFVFVPHFWSSFLGQQNETRHKYRYGTLATETIKFHKLHQRIMPKSLHIALNPMIDQKIFDQFDVVDDQVVPIMA